MTRMLLNKFASQFAAAVTVSNLQQYPKMILLFGRPLVDVSWRDTHRSSSIRSGYCCFVTLSLLAAYVSAWWTPPQFSQQPPPPCRSTATPTRRRQSWLPNHNVVAGYMLGTFRTTAPSMAWCHPMDNNIDSWNNDNAEVTSAVSTRDRHEPSKTIIYHGEEYELMPIPDRGKVSTHAIHGTLFKESCVARYDVYRRKRADHFPPTSSIENTTATSTDHADVVAIISFGCDLNGHQNIVHGGILALLIDDVLGFGYFAILLQEYESRMHRNNDSEPVDSFDPHVVAVTANLNINYRAPVPAGSTVVVEASIVSDDESTKRRRDKHKFHWNAKVMSLDRATTFCQATSLYVIPKRQLLSR